jgi:hypothetical protein
VVFVKNQKRLDQKEKNERSSASVNPQAKRL